MRVGEGDAYAPRIGIQLDGRRTLIKWMGAEKDILGLVCRVGIGRGYCAAVLVVGDGDDSDWNCMLVVRVSK